MHFLAKNKLNDFDILSFAGGSNLYAEAEASKNYRYFSKDFNIVVLKNNQKVVETFKLQMMDFKIMKTQSIKHKDKLYLITAGGIGGYSYCMGLMLDRHGNTFFKERLLDSVDVFLIDAADAALNVKKYKTVQLAMPSEEVAFASFSSAGLPYFLCSYIADEVFCIDLFCIENNQVKHISTLMKNDIINIRHKKIMKIKIIHNKKLFLHILFKENLRYNNALFEIKKVKDFMQDCFTLKITEAKNNKGKQWV